MSKQPVSQDPGSACNLWHVVSGSSPLSLPVQVGEELDLHDHLLIDGLSRYKPPCPQSLKKLQGESLKDYQRTFILQISKELHLDEWQSFELFQSYLENAFRASPKQLKTLLTQTKHFPSLLSMVLDYYLEERSYILKCQGHLLTHWQDEGHPCRVQFAGVMGKVNKNGQFTKLILDQYRQACAWKAPTSGTRDTLLARPVVNKWVCANLHEQASLLELLLHYYKEFEHTQQSFMELFNLVQAEGFGQRQQNQAHVVSADVQWRLKWIGNVWSCLLLEGFDMPGLLEDPTTKLPKHPLLTSASVVREISTVMLNWGDLPHQLPAMLAWAVLLFMHQSSGAAPSSGATDASQLGSKALRCGVMPYLDGLVSSACLESRPGVGAVMRSTVHTLLGLVLQHFSESSLGDIKVLVSVTGKSMDTSALSLDFWNDTSSRYSSLLLACTNRFPHDFRPLMDLLAVLCQDKEPAVKVFHFLREITGYAESLSDLKFSECSLSDGACYSQVPHHLCKSADPSTVAHLTLPAEYNGVVDGQSCATPFVVWDFTYEAWHLCVLMMDQYIRSTPSVLPVSDVKMQSLDLNLASVVTLVTQLLKHNWSLSSELQPVIERVYLLLQRSVVSASPSQELISSCVQCITLLAQHDAHQVWLNLQQTGFLPHSTTMPTLGSSTMPSVDGRHMASGHLGQLLSDVERAQGHYPITLASLHLLQHLMKGLCSPITGQSWPIPSDWAACLAFVVHEVFMDFYKWRYRTPDICNKIGFYALSIFEVVLKQTKSTQSLVSREKASDKKSSVPSTQAPSDGAFSLSQFLVESLLYGEASVALLNLLSTDIDALDVDSGGHGRRSQLLELSKCGVSVLTLLLQAKGDKISPLEKSLAVKTIAQPPSSATTALFGEHLHLVAVIASFIHHRHDRQLPRLATRLLQQLCMSGAVSIHTCLGSQAVPIREKFVSRLSARTESVSTKVAILEMLMVAVQLQPGLIELFLDLTPIDGASGSKEYTLSRGSCLHPILAFLEKKESCPTEIRSACLGLLYGLWKDRRVSALQAITKSPDFWSNLLHSLFESLPCWKDSQDRYRHHMKVATHAVRILALDLYYSEAVASGLNQQLADIAGKKRYLYWLEQLVPVCRDVDMEEASDTGGVSASVCVNISESRYELLKSLQSLLMVAVTCQASSCKLESSEACSAILDSVLAALRAHISPQHTPESVQSPLQLASLFLFLCKNCQRFILAPEKLIDSLASLLVHIFQTDRAVVQLAWPNLSGALLILIRLVRRHNGPPSAAVLDLLQIYCQCLHALRDNIASETCQALLTSVFVLCELVPWLSSVSSSWRSNLEHHAICTLLTHLLEHCLMTHEHPELVEAILSFYVILSQLPKGADALVSPSLVHQLCLSLARVLAAQASSNGAAARSTWDRPASPTSSSQRVASSGGASAAGSSASTAAGGALDSIMEAGNGQAAGAGSAGSNASAGAAAAAGTAASAGSGGGGSGGGSGGGGGGGVSVWSSVWSLSMQLITNMLTVLRHHFVQSALDFACAHQDRMAETLGLISTHSVAMRHLDMVGHTTAFLHCLSAFHHQWHLVIPQNFTILQGEVLRLCHRCCALLSRPKLLARLAETGNDVGHYDTSQARLLLRRYSGSPPALQRTSTPTAAAAAAVAGSGSILAGKSMIPTTAGSGGSISQMISGLGKAAGTGVAPAATTAGNISSIPEDDDDRGGGSSKRKRGSLALSTPGATVASGVLSTAAAASVVSQAKTSIASSLSAASAWQPIPAGASSRSTRRSRLSFSEEEPTEAEQISHDAVKLQNCLINVIGNCFGVIQQLTPSISDVLLNTALDKADCPLLFTFNFDAVPSLDELESVSFGDAITCVEACIGLLPRGSSSRTGSPRKARRVSREPSSPTKSAGRSNASCHDRGKVMYVVETALLVTMVQAGSYLRHPDLDDDHKRAMKWELNTMMGNLLASLSRQLHTRPAASSPEYKKGSAPLFSADIANDQAFLALVETFFKSVMQ